MNSRPVLSRLRRAAYDSPSCPVRATKKAEVFLSSRATPLTTITALSVLSVSVLPSVVCLCSPCVVCPCSPLLAGAVMATYPVCFPAVVSGPVCSALVGSGSIWLRPGGSWSHLFSPWWVPGLSALLWWDPGPSAPPWRVSVLSALPWWAPGPSAPPWEGFSPVCSALVGSVPSAPPWWAPGPSAPPWGASVRSALPWWAPVPSSPPWLPHGPGPPSLPLFHLRSTTHLELFKSVWKPLLGGGGAMSRIVAMNFASHTTRGHSPTTWTFTQLQITHRLHFPSFTAPTQLFTIITLAPVHHHPITHTLHKPWTFSHTLPSIVLAQLPYQAFPCFPC